MAKSLIEAVQGMSDAFTNFHMRLKYGHEGIAKAWEQKMHPGVFELRMDMRRDARKERKNMALLRVLGGILQIFFWIFVIIGTLLVVGVIIAQPLIAAILGVCLGAAILEVWRRRQ